MRLILGIVLSCAALGFACAEEGARPAQMGGYSPDLAELMASAQLRHLKLGYAGRLGNWDLAEFEVLQLRKNFADARKYFPEFHDIPVANLLREHSEPALDDITASIKAKDVGGFGKSFERLTKACNSCHQAAGVDFIEIRPPTASPFSNQVFEPQH